MNGFLWLGVASTVFLALAVVADGFDASFDALDFGPGWFSLPVVAAFLAAFGFGAGALLGSLGAAAVVPGLVAGVAFAALAGRLASAAMHMPTDATESEATLLGALGRVVTAPTASRYGEVLLARPAGPVKVACTAAGAGQRLPVGTEVVVVDVVSSTLVTVEPFDADDPFLAGPAGALP